MLDGGLSNALADGGVDLRDPLWTARVLLDEPDRVAAVHEAYFRAGADVITTATYQASVPSLVTAGLSEGEAEELLRRGVAVAREVRDRVAPDGLVAASVGPYGAVLADGSEYRGRYGLGAAALRDFHAPRLELLVAAGPDVLAVETIPDLDEAVVLVDLLSEFDTPAWLSFAVLGDRTRAGEPLPEAFAAAASLAAVGVNCSAPADVLPALLTSAAASGRPGVAYPNRGEQWDAERKQWTGSGAFDPALVPQWIAAGAVLVGGCCRVGPGDIAVIADRMRPSSWAGSWAVGSSVGS